MSTKTNRQVREIAQDIKANWGKPYFGARPYIDAMMEIGDVSEKYGSDPAKSIIAYFLANAGTWRGDHAKRIKAELRAML